MRTKIAIFASGAGSNADNLLTRFKKGEQHSPEIVCIISNKPDAGVLDVAARHGVEARVFNKKAISEDEGLSSYLDEKGVQGVVLAGFLLMIPGWLLDKYPNKVLNIHPALLPKFGGKGMYGMHVHEAVKAAGETHTGITIHLCNHEYDKGPILLQAHCSVSPTDSPKDIAHKIHALEYRYLPVVVESLFAE